jgi:surfactin synthase thioesterase subunit
MSVTHDMRATETGSTAWLRRYHPGGSGRARLVCFPHAGGSASFFHPVSARFSPDADVIALQYPGRQDRRREPCLDDIATLADRITAELLPMRPRPTVLFGHSMGAVLAFEVTWRLEQIAGFEPGAVIASGRRAPSARRAESVHRLDDQGIIKELRRLNGTDAAVFSDDEILRMALPAIRGDYRAIETYECATDRRLRSPITVLTGDTDPKTTLTEAQAWRLHTEGEFRLRSFPGGHFFLLHHKREINLIIADELERVGAAG